MAPDTLLDALLDSWDRNYTITINLLRSIPDEAMDLTPLPAGEPIAAVLKIRGGRAAELGIREGDAVTWTH